MIVCSNYYIKSMWRMSIENFELLPINHCEKKANMLYYTMYSYILMKYRDFFLVIIT